MPCWDGDASILQPPRSRRCFILLSFDKVANEGAPESTTPPSSINAWWRWIRSGQRNPPVITSRADMHRDRLFKIAHFDAGPLWSETGQYPPIVRCRPNWDTQFQSWTASRSEQRAAVGCSRPQRKPQPFHHFPSRPRRPNCPCARAVGLPIIPSAVSA